MKTLVFDEASKILAKAIHHVCQHQEPIEITREDGESVVMLTLADHSSMVETLHLLGNSKNAAWLRESVAQHRKMRTNQSN